MDACNIVEKEVDKVISKFSDLNEQAEKVLGNLTESIQQLKENFDNEPADSEITDSQADLLDEVIRRSRDTAHKLAADHRDLHSTVSKVGKSIDRNFASDFASTSREDAFLDNDELINQAILQHFYRQGMQDIADELAKESGVKTEENVMEPFIELNHILESLKQRRDLDPAFEWVKKHRQVLNEHNSTLEFQLHRLKFIEIIKQGIEYQEQAIQYARQNFSQFVDKHEKEIQTLMGLFLYLPKGVNESPYMYLLDPQMWNDVCETLTQAACNLLGLSVDSPLAVCINAGCKTIPSLLNIKQVMIQRQVNCIWNGKDELPIEIDLGTEMRFHSVFACPILKQQSSEANPPMKLICGHVVSREALTKLAYQNKLKCPYCPVEQMMTEARLISF